MEKLTKLERKYLSRHICWLCEIKLHNGYCGGFEKCPEDVMAKRRADCLAEYKPRRSLTAAKGL
jgi:hypothetical protein